jgi:hypothetical protein
VLRNCRLPVKLILQFGNAGWNFWRDSKVSC